MPTFDEPSELPDYDGPRDPQYGPLDDLHGAIRAQAPKLRSVCSAAGMYGPRPSGVPDVAMKIASKDVGPYWASWDEDSEVFRWSTGPDAGAELGTLDELEETVRRIAAALGILHDPEETADRPADASGVQPNDGTA